MRRKIIFFMCAVLTTMVLPSGCNKKGINKSTINPLVQAKQNFDISWKEASFKASLKPYTVKEDLSNVSNISQFVNFDELDKATLFKQQFIIKKPDIMFEQPFNVYEKNKEDNIPNLITCDSILHVYHLIYDYTIKVIERERLVDELKTFTKASFEKSLEIYNGIRDKEVKKAAVKNVAYFGIAMRLLELDLPGGIPIEANRIIDNDVKRIRSRWSSGTSEIFPYYIDYKGYIVRGHYSRETDFRNYFLTMMWYGNTPLMLETYDASKDSYKRMDEEIAMSILMTTQILGDENLRKLWDDIYKVSAVYWGKVDDVTLYDMSDIVKVVYGEKVDLNKIWNGNKIRMVYELAKQRYNLHSMETIGGRIIFSNKNNKRQTQFRLMGRMYNIDTDIFNNLTISGSVEGNSRTMPKGLDIPAAFGSTKAYDILRNDMGEDKKWNQYSLNMEMLREVLNGSNSDNPFDYSLNNSLFWVLKPSVKSVGEGYPSFMTNDNYNTKRLLTFVGAISDTRHPSALNAKQGEAKNVNITKEIESEIPGYIEPDIELYSRLEFMAKYIKAFLSANNFNNAVIHNNIDNLIDSVSFLKNVSIKELENKPFTKDEEMRIKNFDRELKALTLNAVEGKGSTKQWEMVPNVDRNMAVVSDAYSYENQVLQTAIGSPDYIYAVVPYNGKLYITRGSVYTYYEFIQSSSKKLDDSSWQEMIQNKKEVEVQQWIKNIRK